ncbi:MAG: hypothetical protein LIO67_08050 [Lachnospiraceae bacterium]|nr:hypothetical protein [Lachnospiraceae bacterium]
MKILWTAGHGEAWEQAFAGHEIVKAGMAAHPEKGLNAVVRDPNELYELVADKDVLLLGSEPITRDVLEHAPDLKLILSERDGPEENIDLTACAEMGIPVFAAGGRCAGAVAELILAMMMALARRIPYYNRRLCSPEGWPARSDKAYNKFDSMYELSGKTLSIIGFGRNGRALRKLVSGFDMRVLVYDPFIGDEVYEECNIEKATLEEALSQGDFVTTQVRVTKENVGMIGREQIALMKPTAFFINCARPDILDEQALYDAVKEKRIQGIGLDVFSEEGEGVRPMFADLPLDRCIITPHIAGFGDKRAYYSYTYMLESFTDFLNGVKPSRCYNPAVYDSPKFAEHGGLVFGVAKS